MAPVLEQLTGLVVEVQRRSSLEDLLQAVVDRTATLLEAEHASIRLLNPSRTHLVAVCRTQQPLQLEPAEFRRGEGLLGWIVEHEQTLRLVDPARDPRFVVRPGTRKMGQFLGTPILAGQSCVGVLSVIRGDEAFTVACEQLLTLAAAICAPYLEIARLSRLSELDPLTGALNRRGLRAAFAQSEPVAPALDAEFRSVVMADIDRFKAINDTHGHAVGDEVLRHVARLLTASLRTSDAIVRYGGEEFLLVFPKMDQQCTLRIAERARRAVQDHATTVGEAEIKVTISMGVAEQRVGESIDAVIARADAALYQAKQTGRNLVVAAALPAQGTAPAGPRHL